MANISLDQMIVGKRYANNNVSGIFWKEESGKYMWKRLDGTIVEREPHFLMKFLEIVGEYKPRSQRPRYYEGSFK